MESNKKPVRLVVQVFYLTIKQIKHLKKEGVFLILHQAVIRKIHGQLERIQQFDRSVT